MALIATDRDKQALEEIDNGNFVGDEYETRNRFAMAFIVEDIDKSNEQESIKNFITKRYSGCDDYRTEAYKLNEEYFRISPRGGTEATEDPIWEPGSCFINYGTETLYSQKYEKIISWDYGQDCSIASVDGQCLMFDIGNSVNFR